eukprot:2079901-Amphidinium_carterae.1
MHGHSCELTCNAACNLFCPKTRSSCAVHLEFLMHLFAEGSKSMPPRAGSALGEAIVHPETCFNIKQLCHFWRFWSDTEHLKNPFMDMQGTPHASMRRNSISSRETYAHADGDAVVPRFIPRTVRQECLREASSSI